MSLVKIANYLEAHGWTQSVAGKEDFESAIWAIDRMISLERGIIISGEYGVGKSALARILVGAFGSTFKIRLAVTDDLRRFTSSWQEYNAENPYAQNVWLDDLGAESPVNEYGVRRDPAGDFIVQYHELRHSGTRLICTTNYRTDELDERYGGRVLSRLKDLCIPLRLNGSDKREWIRRGREGGAK